MSQDPPGSEDPRVEVRGGRQFQVGDQNAQYNIDKQYNIEQLVLVIQGGGGTQHAVVASGDIEQQTVRRLLDAALGQKEELERIGVQPGIAAPVLPAGGGGEATGLWQMLPAAPSSPGTDPAQTRRLTTAFNQVSALRGEVDDRVDGTVVAVRAGSTTLDLADLLVQQGSYALWRFRSAYARLFGEQMTAFFRAMLEWPAPPETQLLNSRAAADVQVLRGMAFSQLAAALLADQPGALPRTMNELAAGRWREVLAGLERGGRLDAEQAAQLRTQLEAIGQPFVADDVTTAVREAEQAFREALSLDPANTSALVNLATLLSESAAFDYVASGWKDRARLIEARDRFAEAHALLLRRTDPAGRGELARCRLYAAVMLPPDAVLESVQPTIAYTNLMRASISRAAQQTIRWDVVQRGLARSYADFLDTQGIAEARDLFVLAGERALANQCMQTLALVRQAQAMRDTQVRWMQAIWPIVGLWSYRGGNMFTQASGVIVFDADGHFHWAASTGPGPMMPARQELSIGDYGVEGNVIRLQGMGWTLLPVPAPTGSGLVTIVVQNYNQNQLYLFSPADGIQVLAERM